MGSWFANISVRKRGGIGPEEILRRVSERLAGQGYGPAASPEEADVSFAVVTKPDSRWYTLYYDGMDPGEAFSAGMAAELSAAEKTCVICDTVEDHMQRYYKTVAELYFAEEDFRELLGYTKGFCLHDYAQLLLNSRYASLKTNEYIKALASLEKENFEAVQTDLQKFCDSHDFRNAGKDLGTSKDALRRARTRLYGKKKQ